MADALTSPAVGGAMWAVAAGALAYSARGMRREPLEEEHKAPLMGVVGAFVFAAQMINFTIPGTGASGHIGGGLLLCAVLGAPAALCTLAVVLAIQALFFADGGLLALGANIVNMGVATCMIAYPLIFVPLTKGKPSSGKLTLASVLAAVAGLQLGAFGVVIETLLSGRTALPFGAFAALMQPIHLAIGLGEGLITASLLIFLRKAAPETLLGLAAAQPAGQTHPENGVGRRGLALLAVMALLCGGVLAWFASSRPDGLEWSMEGVAGTAELSVESPAHRTLQAVQDTTAFMPDYAFPASEEAADTAETQASWPNPDAGTSLAGVVGGVLTLLFAGLFGLALTWHKRRKNAVA